jgi:hypothetical protein
VWAAAIVDAISASRVFVLVLSSRSNASTDVMREVELAARRGLVIIPFRVENVLPSKDIEYYVGDRQWLDAFPPPLGPPV